MLLISYILNDYDYNLYRSAFLQTGVIDVLMDHIIILANHLQQGKDKLSIIQQGTEEKSEINGVPDHLKITLMNKYIASDKNKHSPSPQPVSLVCFTFI